MARLLFTMVPANDLGLPTRLVPIARALAYTMGAWGGIEEAADRIESAIPWRPS